MVTAVICINTTNIGRVDGLVLRCTQEGLKMVGDIVGKFHLKAIKRINYHNDS